VCVSLIVRSKSKARTHEKDHGMISDFAVINVDPTRISSSRKWGYQVSSSCNWTRFVRLSFLVSRGFKAPAQHRNIATNFKAVLAMLVLSLLSCYEHFVSRIVNFFPRCVTCEDALVFNSNGVHINFK